MLISAAALGKLLGQLAGRQASGLAVKQTSTRLWAVKAAHEALGVVPPPHPTRRLAKWLKTPDGLKASLGPSERPVADIVADINQALGRNRRWHALATDLRLERATLIAAVLPDAVLSARTPQDAVRAGTGHVLTEIRQ